ncbi:MAG: DUF935 domain-containing protein [Micavibrio aeruginosavorus]|uniref:DUF935 domain-containing protein n=1 Tax=Micavibrio aeruginosavorus TaxID=349221 RepID=A0A2W5Q1G7_9BACT|nr:MAG: DUF935 domain-containing protein [Micavibrio aeruginosavorus]
MELPHWEARFHGRRTSAMAYWNVQRFRQLNRSMVMTLKAPDGSTVKEENLKEEVATATTMGVRSILSSSQMGGLRPEKVARILREADTGDATRYLELAEELEEKDAHYISVIGTRKRAVAQLDITVEAASEDAADVRNADFVREWLQRDTLEGEVFDMLDAIPKGFSVTEIIWETTADRWIPKDLKWRDPRWFEFSEDGETLLMKDSGKPVALEPHKFIIHKHASKSGLPVRGGVVRPCLWMWLFKNFSIKDWVIFAEAYGQPMRVGKYPSGTAEDDKAVLMRAVANIGSDAAAIIPESMTVEFIEAAGKTGTADVFQRLCDFCDQQMSKAVLGQTTTTDQLSGGGLAGNQSHEEVRGDIERSDAKQLASTLNKQLIPTMIAFNFGPQVRYPRLRIGRAEQVDIKLLGETAKTAVDMGMKISASKTREALGLQAPDDDNDILQPLSMAPAPAETLPSEEDEKQTASENKPERKDLIDSVVEEMAADYEEALGSLVDSLQNELDNATSLEDFRERLLQVANTENLKEMSEKIGNVNFMARLAGNLKIRLDGKDDGGQG